jgi:ABC-type glycerol-3-phosphate transport system permease component
MGISRSQATTQHRRQRKILRAVPVYLFLFIISILIGAPFFWMVTTALKPFSEVVIYPPRWIPSYIRWENFVEAWRAAPFARFYVNSIIVTVTTTILELFIGLFSAYAFARLDFPKKDWLFALVLATLMIPGQMKLIPNFVTLKRLGWINTYWALIIPPAANAFGTFLMRENIMSLPSELFDAAKIDGAGHLSMIRHLVIPLTRPILGTMTLLGFIGHWNAYLWPLIVTNTADMRTLPIGLVYMRMAEGGNIWNLLMAGTIFVTAPILIVFIFNQNQLIEGVTRGALKG